MVRDSSASLSTPANVWLRWLWKLFFFLACSWNFPCCNLWPFISSVYLWKNKSLHLLYKLQLGRCRQQEGHSQTSFSSTAWTNLLLLSSYLVFFISLAILVAPYSFPCTREPQIGQGTHAATQLTPTSRTHFPGTLRIKWKKCLKWMQTSAAFQHRWRRV